MSEINIDSSIGSDHSILLHTISLRKHANRRQNLGGKIKSHIQDVIQETFDLSDKGVKWEFLKYKIRFFIRI